MIWRLVKIGIPASIMGVQQGLGQLVLMWFMTPFGTLAVAAHTLGQRVEMMLTVPTWGMGQGAGVLAGQNLGARRPERAERTGWLAAGLVQGFMLACSLSIFFWAEGIVHIFSSEPHLVEIASTFLRIATVGYLVFGLTGVFQQCISSAGDTMVPMVVSLVMVWLVQMPLAFFLPRVTDLGVYGVRWAIVASVFVGSTAYTIYFRLGRWKRKKV
jgi:Na+-driven multidrug efflux pump